MIMYLLSNYQPDLVTCHYISTRVVTHFHTIICEASRSLAFTFFLFDVLYLLIETDLFGICAIYAIHSTKLRMLKIV